MLLDNIESYGPSNVIIALGTRQHIPTKRRLSEIQSPPNPNKCIDNTSIYEMEDEEDEKKWSCHTNILYKESPYFASLFGENFIESKASIVFLPTSIIHSNNTLDNILYYMYTHKIKRSDNIKEVCSIYTAADYLGMNELCKILYSELNSIVHNFICYCNTCIMNVPELFNYCIKRVVEIQDEKIALMIQKMINLISNDPEKSLSTYWSSRHMARLLVKLSKSTSNGISQKVLFHVNKSNAIESLYACFVSSNILSTNDPLLSWSKPLHATLTSVQSRATKTIANHFDFFCSQYPALLSCIDGITYSFDFLEYLLLHILEDEMDCYNVGILYQGIVCDLMSRHAVEYNDHVKHILNVARLMILCYITRRLSDIKSTGRLDKLENNVLKLLADDLDVKPKSLISSSAHPLFNRGLFSFLLPSVPDFNVVTSVHSNGLSRHSSRSTTTSRRINSQTAARQKTCSFNFAKRLARLFKKFGPHHHGVYMPPRPVRNPSASTVHTASSSYTSSWLQVRLSTNKERKKLSSTSFSSRVKQKRRFSASASTHTPIIGLNKRVQLIRRPNITVGTVLFIGHVDFAEGIWLGVELDRRVGKNDGSVDGNRYFTSSPNRGVFVRPEDVSLVL